MIAHKSRSFPREAGAASGPLEEAGGVFASRFKSLATSSRTAGYTHDAFSTGGLHLVATSGGGCGLRPFGGRLGQLRDRWKERGVCLPASSRTSSSEFKNRPSTSSRNSGNEFENRRLLTWPSMYGEPPLCRHHIRRGRSWEESVVEPGEIRASPPNRRYTHHRASARDAKGPDPLVGDLTAVAQQEADERSRGEGRKGRRDISNSTAKDRRFSK